MKEYIPPKHEFTQKWMKEISIGSKKHFKLANVNWMFDFPKDVDLTSRKIYEAVETDETVT